MKNYAETATVSGKWYFISELNGSECAEVRHGWVAVRELIYQGARPVFRLASSEQRALELKEETLWTRAHKQGKAYVKKHPGYALSHGDRISGAHHLA
jgi:hypothetical protein